MIRTILWTVAILGLIVLFQTTILNYFIVFGLKPDILLIVFVVLATQNGSFVSQIVGFILGIILDMITNVPLGFHALQFSLAGYLFGLGSGKVYFDPIIMPAFLGLLASVYSLLTNAGINFAFRLGESFASIFHMGVLFQLLINVVTAPIVFFIYGWIRQNFQNQRRGFGN